MREIVADMLCCLLVTPLTRRRTNGIMQAKLDDFGQTVENALSRAKSTSWFCVMSRIPIF